MASSSRNIFITIAMEGGLKLFVGNNTLGRIIILLILISFRGVQKLAKRSKPTALYAFSFFLTLLFFLLKEYIYP